MIRPELEGARAGWSVYSGRGLVSAGRANEVWSLQERRVGLGAATARAGRRQTVLERPDASGC